MTIIVKGLNEVRQNMRTLANFVDSEAMSSILWEMGEETRRQCQAMCTNVVYASPPSKTYTRTGYLRAAMYITMLGRNDRASVQAVAYALAQATYPNRSSNSKTYRMVPHTPYVAKRAVRISAAAVYAAYVEYGTDKMSPRPFMRAGSDAGQRQIMSVAEHGIAREVSKISKGRASSSARDSGGRFVSSR